MDPIETEWRGYRFRSRLEARWAVLFETLRLSWRYEPEGYEMHDGTKYLPDFRVDEIGIHVEVKGGRLSREDEDKLKGFALEKGPVWLLEEIPAPSAPVQGTLYAHSLSDSGGGIYRPNPCLAYCSWCGRFVLDFEGTDSRLTERDREIVVPEDDYRKWLPGCGCGYAAPHRGPGEVSPAVEAARSARFEHGQSPEVPTLSVPLSNGVE